MAVREIARLVHLNESRRFVVPWDRVCEDLGTAVPSDYRRMVEHFGPGEFSPYLHLLVPGVASPALDLTANARGLARALRLDGASTAFHPTGAFPAPGGLLRWGGSGAGEGFYWETANRDPNQWPVVVTESRGPEFYEFSGTMSDFVLGLLRGDVDVPFIPKVGEVGTDLEDEVVEFVPADVA